MGLTGLAVSPTEADLGKKEGKKHLSKVITFVFI